LLQPQKILICEDHDIVIDGLEKLLASDERYSVIGHTRTESDVIKWIENGKPDIVLLDLNLRDQDGFSVLEKIRTQNNTIKVLILTMYDSEYLIDKARALKANGYLLKNVGNVELFKALDAISHGGAFYLSDELKNRRKNNEIFRDEFVQKMHLTKREIEIIQWVVKSSSNEEIAERLFLSIHTVKTHRKNIMKKLGASGLPDMIRFAYENHLV
jgi:DNA-binding NarL/FixJ family response regulator